MSEETRETKLVVITGMSGAGKTVAVRSFEDLGYYCVDKLPPTLLPKFLELMKESTNDINKVALVMDLRGREFFDTLSEALDLLEAEQWIQEHIIFLDATDEVLVSRYKETRRSHPLAPGDLLLNGIKKERKLLDRKSTRLNSSHVAISYAVFCLKKKNIYQYYNCNCY